MKTYNYLFWITLAGGCMAAGYFLPAPYALAAVGITLCLLYLGITICREWQYPVPKDAHTLTQGQVPQVKDPQDPVEAAVRDTQDTWFLPHDYFAGWSQTCFNVYRPSPMTEFNHGRSPLHDIMAGCHNAFTAEQRQRMWNDVRYLQAVAHVFSHQTPEGVKDWADTVWGDGYWEPMCLVALEAIKRGLVGCKCRMMQRRGEVAPRLRYTLPDTAMTEPVLQN